MVSSSVATTKTTLLWHNVDRRLKRVNLFHMGHIMDIYIFSVSEAIQDYPKKYDD